MSQELIGKIQSNLNCSCRLASSLLKQYNRNKSNEIDSQTFDNLVEFCCLCICCVECLMQLGLTGDIRQKNITLQVYFTESCLHGIPNIFSNIF